MLPGTSSVFGGWRAGRAPCKAWSHNAQLKETLARMKSAPKVRGRAAGDGTGSWANREAEQIASGAALRRISRPFSS